jgi:hypothetical protein
MLDEMQKWFGGLGGESQEVIQSLTKVDQTLKLNFYANPIHRMLSEITETSAKVSRIWKSQGTDVDMVDPSNLEPPAAATKVGMFLFFKILLM